MKYRTLGHTGIEVSEICLGSMTWGQQNTEDEGHQQLDFALERGINFIDTAEMYSVPPREETSGKTEEIIGTWLADRKNRQKIILATKIAGRSEFMTWIRNGKSHYNRENIESAIEGSLKRLQTDYIDIYQLHWPNRNTNFFGKLGYYPEDDGEFPSLEETLMVLGDMIKKGKIRHYGISNESPWGFMHCIQIAGKLGIQPPVSIQNPYSLLNRTFEIGNAEISHRENVGLLVYSPLAFGTLTGKYLKGQNPEGSRLHLFGDHLKRYSNNQATSAANDYVQLALRNGLEPSQMAIAFILTRPYVTSVIIGATNMEQLRDNIESIHIKLDGNVMEKIDSIHEKKPNPAP